jgi:hypothetical protein
MPSTCFKLVYVNLVFITSVCTPHDRVRTRDAWLLRPPLHMMRTVRFATCSSLSASRIVTGTARQYSPVAAPTSKVASADVDVPHCMAGGCMLQKYPCRVTAKRMWLCDTS